MKIKVFIALFYIFTSVILSQEIKVIHQTRDKTEFLEIEKLGDYDFLFFYDSTFLDKRIKVIKFSSRSQKIENEFYLTPAVYSIQEQLKILKINQNLILAVWTDYRFDEKGDIYAQLIDENGILFDSTGLVVCDDKNEQKNPVITFDGNKFFYVSWIDFRKDPGGDIYIQAFDLFGKNIWKINGIPVTELQGVQKNHSIGADNLGNCFVAWEEKTTKVSQIYIQKIDITGKKKFGQFGICLSNTEEESSLPFLLINFQQEPVIFWHGIKDHKQIYYQQLSRNGAKRFGILGRKVLLKNVEQELIDVQAFDKNFVMLIKTKETNQNFSYLFQILVHGEKSKFRTPIEVFSGCDIYQTPQMLNLSNGCFIYWLCLNEKKERANLFFQTIDLNGNILKKNGIPILDLQFPLAKIKVFPNDNLHIYFNDLKGRYGIYYTRVSPIKFPKVTVENFSLNYYDGLVKLLWILKNAHPGTNVIVEKKNELDDWDEVKRIKISETLSSVIQSYDEQILDSTYTEYRIKVIDSFGDEFKTELKSLSIRNITDGFFLYQNTPNPFKDSTVIAFKIPVKTKVIIKIFNSRLEEIETITDQIYDEGLYEIVYKPLPTLSNGIYFYRMNSKNFKDVKKMILSR